MRCGRGWIVVAIALLAGCGDDTDEPASVAGASSAPSATTVNTVALTTVVPTTVVPTTVVPTTADDAMEEFASARCCEGTSVAPGTYALPPYVEPPLAVDVPDGWRAVNATRGRLFALVQSENEIGEASRWLAILPAGDQSVDTLVETVTAMDVLDFAPSTETDVLGVSAAQLDATALPNPDAPGAPDAGIAPGTQPLNALEAFVEPGFVMTTSSPEARLRFLVVDAGSGALVIFLEAPADEFDGFVAEADEVLATLTLLD